MVDLGPEADHGRLERVLGWECNLQLEVAALPRHSQSLSRQRAVLPYARRLLVSKNTYSICRLLGAIHQHFPFGHVLFVKIDLHARRGVSHAFAVLLPSC